MEQKDLRAIFSKIKKQGEWGTYFMGKYYFTIATHKKKAELGLQPGPVELSKGIQLQLQWDNYPALFHEYIHYLHEMSTVVGNVGIGLDLRCKSIFSHYFNTDLRSAENLGVNKGVDFQRLAKAITTQQVLLGDTDDKLNGGVFLRVLSIEDEQQEVWFPHDVDYMQSKIIVPKIKFEYFKDGQMKEDYLFLGKYFIYEGLAYELDREVEKIVRNEATFTDTAKGTEYIVLRKIANFVFPETTRKTFLSVASLALQHIDLGNSFIMLLTDVKNHFQNGVTQEDAITLLKQNVSTMIRSKRQDFIEAQEEYKKIFEKRKQLHSSFSYLIEKIERLYDERIKNPAFEVDYVFEGKHRELLDIAQICDYMYLFEDEEDFMRDVFGTSIDMEISQALKVLLSYDHYYKSHGIYSTKRVESDSDHKCPFYYCCNLELRQQHVGICQKKPWRIFEISANSDNQYCWYGQGVLEFKGQNER
jgi:hypothetical protein